MTRRGILRIAALVLAGLLVLSLTVGCLSGEVSYYVASDDLKEITEAEVAVGQALKIHAREYQAGSGCDDPFDGAVTEGVTWKVEPADGAIVQGGRFIATKPGTYTVTPVIAEAASDARISSLVITVADDGSVTTTSPDGIDYTPLLGAWTHTRRIVKWDDVETWKPVEALKTETIVFSLGAGGVLKATLDGVPYPVTYDGTTVTVGDPTSKDGAAVVFTGTVSGDTISGTISYPAGGKVSVFDDRSETKTREVDLAMEWTATRVR